MLMTALYHRGSCFICLRKVKLQKIKKESIIKAYKDFKIVIKSNALHCSRHLDKKGVIKPKDFVSIRHKTKFYDREALNELNNYTNPCKKDIFEQFNDLDSLSDKDCLQITGWSKEVFTRFCKYSLQILVKFILNYLINDINHIRPIHNKCKSHSK
jgi:hypothetical protein